MTKDRLSDIWTGFSQRSSLDLAGTSVEDTPRPSREFREHRRGHDEAAPMDLRRHPAPADAQDPVAAALSAMHQEMSASGQKRRGRKEPVVPHHSEPPASAVEQTLLADLAFTRSKTTRRDGDYITFAAGRQAEWQRRKRKKFLGIF